MNQGWRLFHSLAQVEAAEKEGLVQVEAADKEGVVQV